VSGAENGAERAENRLEWSGERAKSAAQNSLHRKTTNVKNLNRFLKFFESRINLAKKHHFSYAAL